MPDFHELFKTEQAKKMMNDRVTIDRIKNAPESQRLLELLSQQSNGNPEHMVNAAAKGDTEPLISAIQKLIHDPESQKLLQEISRDLNL